ncbi:MAG: hypothetical protein H8D42_04730, partial [Candidatus Marinimicrobia bacterium]|nr:hypothetical protein [Candidatus Neomarinimicrobiota bacterium]
MTDSGGYILDLFRAEMELQTSLNEDFVYETSRPDPILKDIGVSAWDMIKLRRMVDSIVKSPSCEGGRKLSDDEYREWIRQLRRILTTYDRPGRARYVPNGKWEYVIKTIATGKPEIVYMRLGNGSGKTAFTTALCGQLFKRVNNPWFDYPFFKNFPYPKKACIIGSPSSVADDGAFKTEWRKWIGAENDDDCVARKKSKSFNCTYIFKDTEWEVSLFTSEQDWRELEGPTFGLIVGDEPFDKSFYEALTARTRSGCLWLLPGTPVSGSRWMTEELAEKADFNLSEIVLKDSYDPNWQPPSNLPDGATVVVDGQTWENCREKGIRGVLSEKYINRMMKKWTDVQIRTRIYGEPSYLEGRIIDTYDPNVHFLKNFDDFPVFKATGGKIPYHYPIYCVNDPHPKKPCCLLWFTIAEYDRMFVIDEWPEWSMGNYYQISRSPLSWEELAVLIKAKETSLRCEDDQGNQAKVGTRYFIDPRGSKDTGEEFIGNIKNYFAMRNIYFDENIDTRMHAGIEIVKMDFQNNNFYIFPHCKQTDWAIRNHVYKQDRNLSDQNVGT